MKNQRVRNLYKNQSTCATFQIRTSISANRLKTRHNTNPCTKQRRTEGRLENFFHFARLSHFYIFSIYSQIVIDTLQDITEA